MEGLAKLLYMYAHGGGQVRPVYTEYMYHKARRGQESLPPEGMA